MIQTNISSSKLEELKSYLSIEDLTNIVLLANTPLYIYKNFRNDSSISRLAKEKNTFLAELYQFISSQDLSNFENHVIGYAILVAATLKDYYSASTFLSEQNFSWLQGGEGIKDFHLKSDVATNTINVLPKAEYSSMYYPTEVPSSNIIKMH